MSSQQSQIADNQCAFQWFWRGDRNPWEPYQDEHNCRIERAFELFKQGGPSEGDVGDVSRLNDDVMAKYFIDFNTMQQHPKQESDRWRSRAVKREPKRAAQWESLDDASGQWQPMLAAEQAFVSQAYEAYVKGSGPGTGIVMRTPDRPEDYELDLIRSVMRNLTTGTSRPIRRV
ncbi:hypothetical protein PAPYR_11311 [Paratrimastix pyriformis]|uniref:WWE domain-containing protein n=1 Tax=Paratrimastix pyriformis TaxID=342808 RepID=A0ABQ8U887_9EUKA|nr:hypothetical protein PAPYR_11311 [Paratrimastix pyriformis]